MSDNHAERLIALLAEVKFELKRIADALHDKKDTEPGSKK